MKVKNKNIYIYNHLIGGRFNFEIFDFFIFPILLFFSCLLDSSFYLFFVLLINKSSSAFIILGEKLKSKFIINRVLPT